MGHLHLATRPPSAGEGATAQRFWHFWQHLITTFSNHPGSSYGNLGATECYSDVLLYLAHHKVSRLGIVKRNRIDILRGIQFCDKDEILLGNKGSITIARTTEPGTLGGGGGLPSWRSRTRKMFLLLYLISPFYSRNPGGSVLQVYAKRNI